MDTIANMLVSIKNGNRALKESVVVPASKFSFAVATKLSQEGYVGKIEEKTRRGRPVLEIELISDGKTPKIKEITRISKPSRRLYASVSDIRPYKNGHGLFIYSTPKGILSDKDARKEHVGGEVLFSIW